MMVERNFDHFFVIKKVGKVTFRLKICYVFKSFYLDSFALFASKDHIIVVNKTPPIIVRETVDSK
ncbi:hypothetical protein SAMN05421738_108169 [Algoriella xinjiangensis]|uniref:Uncharacterized protein n=1 Tax=Algoriella xinjiangensis TaxID=684065 RepID=A0A1I4X9N2_9FLAO|nr:hypothetical protein SAMN05421738_108169 [Algoriella xinjiangensis]